MLQSQCKKLYVSLKIVQGCVNGDTFYDFICEHNGVNEQSVVITGNCSIHQVEQFDEVLQDSQVIVLLNVQ